MVSFGVVLGWIGLDWAGLDALGVNGMLYGYDTPL